MAAGHKVDASINPQVHSKVGLDAQKIFISQFFVIGSKEMPSSSFLPIVKIQNDKIRVSYSCTIC